MAFSVGDIVKKISGEQKYKVTEVLPNSKYQCQLEPEFSSYVRFRFKETDLELAS